MGKTAFITGIAGQDGAYLAKLLLDKGYRVIGGARRSSHIVTWRLEELGALADTEIVDLELGEMLNIYRILEKYQPDELYNLGAQSFVAASFEQPLYTADIDAMAVTRLLEAIRTVSPQTRYYQASTSEMFGKVVETPQTENTPFYPRSPYGVAKLYGHWMTINYREAYGLHTSSGILFNHESPVRGENFVTRKISLHLSQIKHGMRDVLELGNLDARRDWGFAGDYVEGMWRMVQAEKPDDYVLATGEAHSIREFIKYTAQALGMAIEWRGKGPDEIGIDVKTNKTIIQINPKYYRPAEVEHLIGVAEKAREKLGWTPSTNFRELVEMMTIADERRVVENRVCG
ncbi:MAG: GDP-mannose 4,6-dehydratase [Robiginitomaculum sp.]|nr:MAG: GDP-mannose 4,6-dehydratase [Robiginitomaculum sp.]